MEAVNPDDFNINWRVFFSRFEIGEPDECWEWRGFKISDGYGRIGRSGGSRGAGMKSFLAHRLSFQFFNGPISEGTCICHRCDNPACVNPAHLFEGTHTDNMQDMLTKGRANKAHGEAHLCAKMSVHKVIQLREEYATGKFTISELSRNYGVVRKTIQSIINRKTWKHVA